MKKLVHNPLQKSIRISYALSFDWNEIDEAPDISHRKAGAGQPNYILKWPKK